MNSRTCKECGELKPFTREFFSPRRHVCNACQNARSKKHTQENPEKKTASRAAYNQRIKSAKGFCSENELLMLRLLQQHKCYYCEKNFDDEPIEKDHRTSLFQGGTNDPCNIVYACRTCNRDKGKKNASEFFAWRRFEGLNSRIPDACFFCEADITDAGSPCLCIPIQKGGAYLRENIVWACPNCHTQKNHLTAAEYLSWRRQNGLKTRPPVRIVVKKIRPK